MHNTCLAVIGLTLAACAPMDLAQSSSSPGPMGQESGSSSSYSAAEPPPKQPSNPALYERGRQLLQAYQASLFKSVDVKTRGYDIMAYTALKGCGPSKMADDLVDTLRPDLIARSPDKAAYAFVLPPFTRYVIQYGACLRENQVNRARDLLSLPQELFSHGTLNHALMSSTSYYLLAQRFPDLRWADSKGMPHTSSEIEARYKDLLLKRFHKFMANGFNEQLSPTYAMNNLYPLINLIDFAQDEEVRTAAEQMAVAQIGLLRADSIDGAVMPPLERENAPPQISSNPPTNVRDILWFYYGGFGPIDSRRYEPPYGAMLVASHWQPPQQLLTLKTGATAPYDIRIATPGFSQWDGPTMTELVGGAHIEPQFAIGTGTAAQDPSGYFDHTSTFRILLQGLQPVGAIECYQPYWHGDEGEDAWDTDRSSPFEQVWPAGRNGLILFDTPSTDPYPQPSSNHFFTERSKTASHLHQLADCRLPSAADEFSSDGRIVTLRYGHVFVALRSIGSEPMEINKSPTGNNLKGFMTVKVRGSRVGLLYEVEPVRPGDTLQGFSQYVAKENVTYSSAADSANLALPDGQSLHAHFQLDYPGKMTRSPDLVADSPIFRWKNAQVFFGGH